MAHLLQLDPKILREILTIDPGDDLNELTPEELTEPWEALFALTDGAFNAMAYGYAPITYLGTGVQLLRSRMSFHPAHTIAEVDFVALPESFEFGPIARITYTAPLVPPHGPHRDYVKGVRSDAAYLVDRIVADLNATLTG